MRSAHRGFAAALLLTFLSSALADADDEGRGRILRADADLQNGLLFIRGRDLPDPDLVSPGGAIPRGYSTSRFRRPASRPSSPSPRRRMSISDKNLGMAGRPRDTKNARGRDADLRRGARWLKIAGGEAGTAVRYF